MEQFLSAKFLSGRNANQKIGIVGVTTDNKVLEVVGRVGIGSTVFEPNFNLDVRGSASIRDRLFVSGLDVGSASSLSSLYVSGVSTFVGLSTFIGPVNIQDDLFIKGNLRTLGITTLSENGGITTTGGSLYVGSTLSVGGVAIATQFSTGNLGEAINIGINSITGPSTIIIDPSTIGNDSGTVRIKGDLYVDGTQLTAINFSSGVGTITTLNSAVGIITNLSASIGTITTLNSTVGIITNLSASIGTITTLNSTIGIVTNLSAFIGTIATLDSTLGTITNLSGTIGTITTLNSAVGIITNLSASIGTITTLNSTVGIITNLSASIGTITTLDSANLSGTIGTITTLNSTSGTITNLSASIGTITTLNSPSGTITNLSGTIGTITTLNSTSGTITNLSGTIGTITTLNSTNLNSTNINSTGISTLSNIRSSQLYVSGISTFAGSITGTISTATKLQTARTFQIDGDISALPVSFDGTSNVFLNATIQPNSVGLGTDTFGNYVRDISGTANEIVVVDGIGEGVSSVISFAPNPTISGDLTVTNDVQINQDLNVNGNITIGGTVAFIAASDIRVFDKHIIAGIATNENGQDSSTDTTANTGGIAVASTIGNPLVDLRVVGIETFPVAYKRIFWYKHGTFAGLGTDAWLINYAVGIGSTQVPNGVRLAAGGVHITDDTVTSVNSFQSGITTTSKLNVGTDGSIITTLVGPTRVGINTVSPEYTLDVGGDLNFAGNIFRNKIPFVSGVGVYSGGNVIIGGGATILNFVGTAVSSITADILSGIATITLNKQDNFTRTTTTFVATTNQTTFSLTYVPGYIDVYVSGVRLTSTEYTATDGLNVILEEPCFGGETVDITAYIDSGFYPGTQWFPANGDDIYRLYGNVGIGTTFPTSKLSVGGTVSASSFVGLFIGDGSGLTGIVGSGSGVIITDDDVLVGTASTINFGDHLSVSQISLGIVTVTNTAPSIWTKVDVGIHTLANVGIGTTNPTSKLFVQGDVRVTGVITATTFNGIVNSASATITNINSTGISTLGITTVTNLTTRSINNSGIITTNSLSIGSTQVISSGRQLQNIVALDEITIATIESVIPFPPNTFTDLRVTGITTLGVTSTTNLTSQQLTVSGTSTFSNGPVFIGSASSTGTVDQKIQVTGGAYVSGSIGIGTTNPTSKLAIQGVFGIETTITSVSTTALTTIDTMSIGVFRSARFQVQITQGASYQASDLLIIHNGTNSNIVEYGSISTDNYLAEFSSTISGGSLLLRVSMFSSSSATIKVVRYGITI